MSASLWTYLPSAPGGMLDVNRAFYHRLATETASRTSVENFVVPIRSGKAWPVLAGQLCRIVVIEGPQVADFNCWNLHNPRERFWASRTKQLHRSHVTTYDRLWSTLPYLRPLLTITHDTIDYGVDEDGGRCHDLLGTRCDPYVNQMLTGEAFDYHCHSNLTRAILPYGLTEFDVHDVLNIFQVTGLKDDQYFMKPSPAQPGDFFEFVAEIDLLCAISTCPGRGFIHPAVGSRRWGSALRMPAAWGRGLPAGPGAARGLGVPAPIRLSGAARFKSAAFWSALVHPGLVSH